MDAVEPLEPRGDLRDRPHYSLGELLDRAPQRPDVQALAAGASEAEAEVRLGRALTWPTFGAGASYERDDGNDVALGTVAVTLPLFERGQGLSAEASARRRRLQFEAEASRRAIVVEVESAFHTYRRREEAVVELERFALPVLDENDALVRRSYEVGELRLAEVLAIRGETLAVRSEYLDRLFEAAIAAIDLEASCGILQGNVSVRSPPRSPSRRSHAPRRRRNQRIPKRPRMPPSPSPRPSGTTTMACFESRPKFCTTFA
jgi:cobalt-zinc-cadmium efflux system outer membrane protein